MNTKQNIILLSAAFGILFPSVSFAQFCTPDKCEVRFEDGAGIAVHFVKEELEKYSVDPGFPSQVLDAAANAYQTITKNQGFNTAGFGFADADRKYAYDPDKTIDIYLGALDGKENYPALGDKNRMFADAPCFDVLRLSQTKYQAVILLPVNYAKFMRSWEKINPSPLGGRNFSVDLRGTLMHEMLHAVLFYYNKNLNKSSGGGEHSSSLDWYVEGLARYFETFAGARHDFYSQGFKQTLPDKVRFSRGGANYFMRYPDQPFTHLRYENALFWRFMQRQFGMGRIEKLSRILRSPKITFKEGLEQVTGEPFEKTLQDYAVCVLRNDFGLEKEAGYLQPIAKTRLAYRGGTFFLLDGQGNEKALGQSCATDWIGRWESTSASFDSASVAGDATEEADISPWATDFYEVRLEGGAKPDFKLNSESQALHLQVLPGGKGQIYLLVTNTDPVRNLRYEWGVRNDRSD